MVPTTPVHADRDMVVANAYENVFVCRRQSQNSENLATRI
jgi:hypothetical protein